MSISEEKQKRPRARNARPKIERAALKLFVNEGVDAATTREIAEEAGVSEGALYRHYKGKDELALALFMETHNRLSKMLVEAWTASGSVEERVKRAVAAYCNLADEDWLLFSFHLVSLDRFLPHDVRRDDDPVSVTEALIQDLIDKNEIPNCNPAVMSGMVLGVLMQSGNNKIYSRLPGNMSDHVDAFSKAILAILLQK